MASPRFYWYPSPTGPVHTIDLGESLSDLQEFPNADVTDALGWDGLVSRIHHRDAFGVRIVLERFGEPGENAIERQLQALQSHLNRGGFCAFSRDHDRTWAAAAAGALPVQADNILYTAGNGFSAWSSAAALVEGDELVVESESPDCRRELVLVDSVSAGKVVFVSSPGVVFDYTSPTILRWRDFYPVLYLAEGEVTRQPIVTHDHRRTWTMDLRLEYSVGAVASLYSAGETGFQQTVGGSLPPLASDIEAGGTLERLVRRLPTAPTFPAFNRP